MTVNHRPASAPFQPRGTVAGAALPGNPAERGAWQTRNDAVQLSRLGGVLNVFASDASASLSRLDRLQKAVGDSSYGISATDLGRKLIAEMLVQR